MSIFGTNSNQIPRNVDLGEAAYLNKSDLFSDAKIEAIAKTKNVTAVDVFVYDTRKDSDGGAWRYKCQDTSWYNEGVSIDRGNRKEFPAVAVIIAEATKVTIYDGDDPTLPMWMVFRSADGGDYTGYYIQRASRSITAVSALNGRIAVTQGGSSGNYASNVVINMPGDTARLYIHNGLQKDAVRPIQHRNVLGSYNITQVGDKLDGLTTEDVDMRVLPGAPLDDFGLPIPTIAFAGNNGVAIVYPDNMIFENFGYPADHVVMGDEWFVGHYVTGSADSIWTNPYTRYDKTYSVEDIARFIDAGWSVTNQIDSSFRPLGLTLIDDKYIAMPTSSHGVIIRDARYGLPLPGQANSETHAASMRADITGSYNTGWMPGNHKIATLNGKVTGTVTATELVSNGTFDTDTSGWVATGGATISVDAGRLLINNPTNGGQRAYTDINTIIGKTYTVAVQVNSAGNGVTPLLYINDILRVQPAVNYVGWMQTTFVAESTTARIGLGWNGPATTGFYDNVSVSEGERNAVRLGDDGVKYIGSVDRTPVAEGAELVAYETRSNGGYLKKYLDDDVKEIGTGDFTVQVWANLQAEGLYQYPLHFKSSSQASNLWGDSHMYFYITNSTKVFRLNTSEGFITSSNNVVPFNQWVHLAAVRHGGQTTIYINGVAVASSSSVAKNLDFNTFDELSITAAKYSTNYYGDSANNKYSLFRLSGSAASSEQLRKIYRDEKVLFEPGAQAMLDEEQYPQTSYAVDYDADTGLLHASTYNSRSVFSGLRRVDSVRTPTHPTTLTISASNNMIVEE